LSSRINIEYTQMGINLLTLQLWPLTMLEPCVVWTSSRRCPIEG